MKKFLKHIWSYIGDIHFVGRSPLDHNTVPPPSPRFRKKDLKSELNALIILWQEDAKFTIHAKVKETLNYCAETLETVLKSHNLI